MPLACPNCYRPTRVRAWAKEGRCLRCRPRRVRKVVKVITDLQRLMDTPDNLGGGR